jgi:hypothetical protein
VKTLRDAGCPLQTLRQAQEVIAASWDEDFGDAVLRWDGVDLLRIGEFGEVESKVQHPGQAVLHLVAVPIGRWQGELAARTEKVDAERLRSRDALRSGRPSTPWRASSG